MATIRKRTRIRNGEIEVRYQVQVRLAGYPHESGTFAKHADAAAWGKEHERRLQTGDIPTVLREELQRHTLGSMIDHYIADRSMFPHKRKPSYRNEKVMLEAFREHEPMLCRKTLAQLTPRDFQDYANRCLETGLMVSSVKRKINPIRFILGKYARKERHIPTSDYFKDFDIGTEGPGREHLLKPHEDRVLYKAIEDQCRDNRLCLRWLSLVLMALTTALRRGVLLKLKWGDVDWENKILNVSNTYWSGKKKAPPMVPLTNALHAHLKFYYGTLSEQERLPTSPLFKITPTAHEQAWKRFVKRAGLYETRPDGKIDYFHFHDLRHTATTRYGHLKPIELSSRE
ncbi:MAG: tyrosine-type recombinase/integrase, partial [Xanthobacteraceae bacterium]